MKSQVILPGDLTACNLKGHSVHQGPQKLSGSRILNVDKSLTVTAWTRKTFIESVLDTSSFSLENSHTSEFLINFFVQYLEDKVRLSKAEPKCRPSKKGDYQNPLSICRWICFSIAYPPTDLQELAAEIAGNWGDQAQRWGGLTCSTSSSSVAC